MTRDYLRDMEIVTLRLGGATLQAIGDELGITRERVRQILKRNGIAGRYARVPEMEATSV